MQSTDRRLPELGPNPIEDALQNYQQMSHELGLAREELAAKADMVNDLMRENEFLRRNHDKAVAERDRFQALAVNLATRAVGVKEAVSRLLVEAMRAGAAPTEEEKIVADVLPGGDLAAEMEQLLRIPGTNRDITVRTSAPASITTTAAVPPNRFQ